ncbi:MAG: AAA family ATPase [Candidatus Limnocylindria bacterium]
MQVCPRCGEENPDKFRVCGFCGASLATSATVAPPLPPQQERRTVTIVFSDIVGSTSLGEAIDPEAMAGLLNRYFEAMTAILSRHGGSIQKFIGDAIVAVFGLPQVHEDDALRAVRAAHEMQQSLARLNEELHRSFGTAIEARIGVNTGEIVAGESVTGQQVVTGDTANVAARLEQAAPAMGIFIGGSTYRLVRDAVEVEPMAPLELKGKAEPVAAFRLLAVRATDEGVARRLDAPMVGREVELAALRESFDRAVAGQWCHAVTILGDAGVGKSRLIREFIASLGGGVRVLRGRVLSYGEGITFWPLGEIAREAAGISIDEPAAAALDKLSDLVGEDAIVERLASAIGLSAEELPLTELFWGARRFLELLAAEGPLVVVVDDIHWAEPSFLDLLEHLADHLEGAPVLLLATARQDLLESRPGWGQGSRSSRIALQPLSESEAGTVVANLLGQAGLPAAVRDRMITASGGNPLFVEQMLSMLIDDGLLRSVDGHWEATAELPDLAIPPSIQALLAARLDRLLREERAVIEPAAVIGVEFPTAAVTVLVPDPIHDAIPLLLEAMTGKQLVRPAESMPAEAAADRYRFNHQLIRDTTYHAMLKRGRADIHERYAEWLAGQDVDRIGEIAEIVGYHLEQAFVNLRDLGPLTDHGADLSERASTLLAEAGRRAFAREDMHAAANLMRRSVALRPTDSHDRRDAQLVLAEALDEIGGYAEAGRLLDEIEETAGTAGDEPSAARARLLRLRVDLSTAAGPEWSVRAVTEADRDIPIFDAIGDLSGASLAWRVRYAAHATTGLLGEAAADAEQIIALASRAADERQRLRGMSNVAIALTYGPTPADEALTRLRTLSESAVADRMTSIVLRASMAQLMAMTQEFDAARSMYEDARGTAEELGQTMLTAQLALGGAEIEFRAGDAAAAQRVLEDAAKKFEMVGETYFLASVASMLGRAYLEQSEVDRAWDESERAERIAAADDIDAQSRWRGLRSAVLVERGAAEQAVHIAREGVELTRGVDSPIVRGLALADLAVALMAAGRPAEAGDVRDEALATFESKGDAASADRLRARVAKPELNPSR